MQKRPTFHACITRFALCITREPRFVRRYPHRANDLRNVRGRIWPKSRFGGPVAHQATGCGVTDCLEMRYGLLRRPPAASKLPPKLCTSMYAFPVCRFYAGSCTLPFLRDSGVTASRLTPTLTQDARTGSVLVPITTRANPQSVQPRRVTRRSTVCARSCSTDMRGWRDRCTCRGWRPRG
jgi:hypothetical protein